jgi:hypothetical protein
MSAPTYGQSVIPVRIGFLSCALSRCELVTIYWLSRLVQVMRLDMALADAGQHLMHPLPDLHTTTVCSIVELQFPNFSFKKLIRPIEKLTVVQLVLNFQFM